MAARAQAVPAPQAFVPTPFTKADLGTLRNNVPADNLFARAASNPAPYSREYYFLYLWKEAAPRWNGATLDQQNKILEFFNRAFLKTEDWSGHPDPLRPPVQPKESFQAIFSDAELCAYLETMLYVGFEWYSAKGSSEGIENQVRYLKNRGKDITYEIRWRAEKSRDVQTLIKQGFLAQALVPVLRDSMNLSASWNPFSKRSVNSKMWFRGHQEDNEWYTVVSVATNWRAALTFPKVEQSPELQFLKGRRPEDCKWDHAANVALVEFQGGTEEYRMISYSRVALLLVDTMYFDTQARQGKDQHDGASAFPEQAVSKVGSKSIMGVAEFIRVHHGPEDKDGFSAVHNWPASRRVFPDEQSYFNKLLAVFGVKDPAELNKDKLREAWNQVQVNQVNLKWQNTADGYADLVSAACKMPIVKITQQGRSIYHRPGWPA